MVGAICRAAPTGRRRRDDAQPDQLTYLAWLYAGLIDQLFEGVSGFGGHARNYMLPCQLTSSHGVFRSWGYVEYVDTSGRYVDLELVFRHVSRKGRLAEHLSGEPNT